MDSQGRIKGKINIIDLIIIIVAVCAAAFIAYRYLTPAPDMVTTSRVEVKYYAECVRNWVADSIKVGDAVSDKSNDNVLGVVTAIEKSDAFVYNTDADGKCVKVPYPDSCSLIITTELEAEYGNFGIEMNKAKYAIGHTFTMNCGNGMVTAKFYDMKVINQNGD